jgi:hypothetical protein
MTKRFIISQIKSEFKQARGLDIQEGEEGEEEEEIYFMYRLIT